MTAVMTGGAAAILSLFAGDTWGQIILNYAIYGHLGMGGLAVASMAANKFDNRTDNEEG
ncbi:hypothetical protein OS189_02425 [Sulfitobacter sp. F26169L]|uniref:hypothetical protein n=1 Tax=Sulfitobacter sp. F26169L TaxID=2996015 RepID=UPI002260868D|nr:hypothetical protein [Sulfitobacter sp. F26169L]MCX7565199.1 hypothetical protein [Sulfitobacter sp. F26169L]